MSTTATQAEKPQAPVGVEQSLLDEVVEATERRITDEAILHVYRNIEAYQKMAASIARSGVTHHKTEAHVITIAMAAYEMDIGVMEALRGMYIVSGKLAMETWLMDRLAIRLGVTKTVEAEDGFRCRIVLHRHGWDDMPTEFSLADAKQAEIIADYDQKTNVVKPLPRRDTWKKSTKEMIYWRALAKGLRRIAPDMFGGVYTTDEADGFDARRAFAPEPTDTNAALEALMEKGTDAVEPDPHEMTEDEIDKLRQELNRAQDLGLIGDDFKADALDAAVNGPWDKARDAWDTVRGLMARAEADAEPELPL